MSRGARLLLRLLFLALGLGALALALRGVDLDRVAAQVAAIGAAGALAVVTIYAAEFLADTACWQLTLPSAREGARRSRLAWLGRLYLVRLVGEALNAVLPLASIGGEPVKALLLKRFHAVGFAESGASLVLAKTVTLVALVLFLAAGFTLMLLDPRFSPAYRVLAASGLATFTLAIATLFLWQRLRLSSRFGRGLSRTRAGRRLAERLHLVSEFEDRLVAFYTRRPGRLAAALALAVANWLLGVLGVWATLHFMGSPLTLAEAWMVEAAAQLVRAGTFFIPASLGAQEATFVVLLGTLSGNPAAGLAAALIRRARELLWIGAGLAAAWAFSLRPSVTAGPADAARGGGGATRR